MVCQYSVWYIVFVFFKQKSADKMRISDWSSDVCSSDLIIGPFRLASDEARVVDEEVHVGKHLGDDADVAGKTVLIGFAAERQALVNADVLHPQGTGLLDHAQALLVMQEEAAPARPPLGVALPGRDAPGPGQQIGSAHVLTPVPNAHLEC